MQHNVTFNQMLLESTPSLKLYAYKFTNDQEEANDLLQDTLLRSIRYVNLFKEGTNIRGWLFTIMRNTFINSYRKGTRKQAIITQEEEISSANLLPSAHHNQGEAKFAMRDIQNALNSIPKQLSDPFIRYFEGYKYHEIAETEYTTRHGKDPYPSGPPAFTEKAQGLWESRLCNPANCNLSSSSNSCFFLRPNKPNPSDGHPTNNAHGNTIKWPKRTSQPHPQ